MKTSTITACVALALGCISLSAMSNPVTSGFMANNDTFFSYTGTVTAPDGKAYNIPSYVSTPDSTTYTGRDAAIFVTHNAPTADSGAGGENYTQFLTNWYASADGQNSGDGNPNNTDTGLVQLNDPHSAGVTSATGGWTNSSYTTFRLHVEGLGDANPADYPRLWDAPYTGGAGTDTAGAFGPYSLLLTATFAPGSVTEESPGWYSTTATPTSVTGSFTGSFINDGTKAPGNYSFDFTFIDTNWAGANDLDPNDSYFGASAFTAVPEPGELGLTGFGLLLIGGLALRLQKNRRAIALT
jgi:hypothetical protein